MTGERYAWYKVASHLGMLIEELKVRITYTEFVDWLTFLRKEEERQTKQDFYLAQIAAEVRRGNAKNPRSVKVKDFLVTTQQEKVTSRSKSVWAKALKVDMGEE